MATLSKAELPLPVGTHTVRLGDSFTSKKTSGSGREKGLLSVRYDFKPASIDATSEKYLESPDNSAGGKVGIIVPKRDESGNITDATVFRGSKAPSSKECVLVWDQDAGEMWLELIDSKISVKIARGEKLSDEQRAQMKLPEHLKKAQEPMEMGDKQSLENSGEKKETTKVTTSSADSNGLSDSSDDDDDGSSSDSDDSSSSGSESDAKSDKSSETQKSGKSETAKSKTSHHSKAPTPTNIRLLQDDLMLSESDDD